MSETLSRRACLAGCGSFVSLLAALGTSGCGGKPGAPASCTDDSTLTDSDRETRATLVYVDNSTVAGRDCGNCSLYIQPETRGPCGGCQIIKGGIAERGYCVAWAAKAV
jgi:hypothetical protein